MDFEELYMYVMENVIYEDGRRPNPQDVKRCLSYLTRRGLIKQEQILSQELEDCVNNVTDKRVKNKVKYCLQRGKGHIQNTLRPDRKLCLFLHNIVEAKKEVYTYPDLLGCFR